MFKNLCLAALVAHAAEESFASGYLGELSLASFAYVPFIAGGALAVWSLSRDIPAAFRHRAAIKRRLADIRNAPPVRHSWKGVR